MEYKSHSFAILGFIVLLSCARSAFAQTPAPSVQPIATIDVSQWPPEGSGQLELVRVAFSSENSIMVQTFQAKAEGPQYAQYSVQWENGSFKRITQTPGLRWGGTSSADGRRKLFEFSERKVPRIQHLLEILHTISTLGMSGPEDANGESIWVIDTANGKSCFEWRRSFPMEGTRARFATISPSGDLVAITFHNTLSIYRLPAICDGLTKMHN